MRLWSLMTAARRWWALLGSNPRGVGAKPPQDAAPRGDGSSPSEDFRDSDRVAIKDAQPEDGGRYWARTHGVWGQSPHRTRPEGALVRALRQTAAARGALQSTSRNRRMVGVTGLEPVTPSLSNERSGMEEPQETRLSGPPVGVLGQVLAPTRGGAPLGSGHVADALAAAGALLQNAVQSERHPVLIQAVRVILEAAARSLESDPTFGEER